VERAVELGDGGEADRVADVGSVDGHDGEARVDAERQTRCRRGLDHSAIITFSFLCVTLTLSCIERFRYAEPHGRRPDERRADTRGVSPRGQIRAGPGL